MYFQLGEVEQIRDKIEFLREEVFKNFLKERFSYFSPKIFTILETTEEELVSFLCQEVKILKK